MVILQELILLCYFIIAKSSTFFCWLSLNSAAQVAAIDDTNLGRKLGDYFFFQLAETFYERIMSDKSGELAIE